MKNKGFTLIELLVVISIIGVLAAVILPSLSNSRSRARDAQRLSDIKSIQTALELYYVDNGKYPTTNWSSSHTANWSNLGALIGVDLPIDPLNTSATTADNAAYFPGNYVYSYYNNINYCNGAVYLLLFQLEGRNGNGANDGVVLCGSTFLHSYGNVFVVGMDRYGNLKIPDITGTLK